MQNRPEGIEKNYPGMSVCYYSDLVRFKIRGLCHVRGYFGLNSGSFMVDTLSGVQCAWRH